MARSLSLALLALVGGLITVLVLTRPAPAQGSRHAPPQLWEYHVVPSESGVFGSAEEDRTLLNQLGSAGWELVSVTMSGHGRPRYYILKRPGRASQGRGGGAIPLTP